MSKVTSESRLVSWPVQGEDLSVRRRVQPCVGAVASKAAACPPLAEAGKRHSTAAEGGTAASKCGLCLAGKPPGTVRLVMLILRVKGKVAQFTAATRTAARQAFCPGILQERILDWVAIPFSRGSSQPKDQSRISCLTGGSTVYKMGL